MQETVGKQQQPFAENTLPWLLWESQKKALKVKSRHGMRWHPQLIRFCLTLKQKSASCYEYIRNIGFLTLPCGSTLRAYTKFDDASFGVNYDRIRKLAQKFDTKKNPINVALLHDEMRIKDGLVYDRNTGQLTGYVELGDINQALDPEAKAYATHVLVYMVQGLKEHLAEPVATYATRSLRGSDIYSTFWDVVSALEFHNFQVRSSISDGASSNRKFHAIHKLDYPEDPLTFRALNKYAKSPRPLYFLSCVPHLVKTSRNCWENSGSHLKSRNLTVSTYRFAQNCQVVLT